MRAPDLATTPSPLAVRHRPYDRIVSGSREDDLEGETAIRGHRPRLLLVDPWAGRRGGHAGGHKPGAAPASCGGHRAVGVGDRRLGFRAVKTIDERLPVSGVLVERKGVRVLLDDELLACPLRRADHHPRA